MHIEGDDEVLTLVKSVVEEILSMGHEGDSVSLHSTILEYGSPIVRLEVDVVHMHCWRDDFPIWIGHLVEVDLAL